MHPSLSSVLSRLNQGPVGPDALSGLRRVALVCALALAPALVGVGAAGAQSAAPGAAVNVGPLLSLSATGRMDAAQDWLRIGLRSSTEAAQPALVQKRLKATLDAALAQLKPQASGEQLRVSSGPFSVYPKHGRDGQITGWQGSAELVLEGRDIERVSQAAAGVSGMVVSNLSFSLSPSARRALEAQVERLAVVRFGERAKGLTEAFGHQSYRVVSVQVDSVDGGQMPPMALRAMASPMAMADGAVPTQPGVDTVSITVSGQIEMR